MTVTTRHANDQVYATVREVKRKVEEWRENPSPVWGLDTGFQALNRITGGLHPGLTLVGARTSHGKSAFCMQIALYVIKLIFREWVAAQKTDPGAPIPGQVLIFSPEMTVQSLVERYASQETRVPSIKIKTGTASAEEEQAWVRAVEDFALYGAFYRIWAGEDMAVTQVLDDINDAASVGPPLRLVVIDYLQYLGASSVGFGMNQFEMLGKSVKSLRVVANRLKIPLLVAAQLNRSIEKDRQGGEERPPELSDFEGTGKIEQTATVAMLLWRPPDPQRYAGDLRSQAATIYLKKNADGPTGECLLSYYPDCALFTDPPTERSLIDGGGRA